jgi:hypothetical protein
MDLPWNLSAQDRKFLSDTFNVFHLRAELEFELRTMIFTPSPQLWRTSPDVVILRCNNGLPIGSADEMNDFYGYIRNGVGNPNRYWYFHETSKVHIILSKEPVEVTYYLSDPVDPESD